MTAAAPTTLEAAREAGWEVSAIAETGEGQVLAVAWTHGTAAQPGYRLVVEIPGQLPELPQKRRHWSHHKRDADRWRVMLGALLKDRMRPKAPLRRARIVLTRRSAGQPDYENLAASFKPVVDALCRSRRHGSRYLVRADVLEDDSPDVVERDYRWELARPRMGGVRIEVLEVLDCDVPAFNFQDRFVPGVENGVALRKGLPPLHVGVRPKTQTIRAERKDGRVPARRGVRCSLWWRQRRPERRRLGVVVCRGVDELVVDHDGCIVRAGRALTITGATRLARADGFRHLADMMGWLRAVHGLRTGAPPWRGWLIRW